jgi:hypothetical protein
VAPPPAASSGGTLPLKWKRAPGPGAACIPLNNAGDHRELRCAVPAVRYTQNTRLPLHMVSPCARRGALASSASAVMKLRTLIDDLSEKGTVNSFRRDS